MSELSYLEQVARGLCKPTEAAIMSSSLKRRQHSTRCRKPSLAYFVHGRATPSKNWPRATENPFRGCRVSLRHPGEIAALSRLFADRCLCADQTW